MEAAPGTSTNNSFSIRDLIRILYMEGIIKLIYGEEVLENFKLNVVEQNLVIINPLFVFIMR